MLGLYVTDVSGIGLDKALIVGIVDSIADQSLVHATGGETNGGKTPTVMKL